MESKEKQQDLGLQKLGLEVAKQSVPYLLANPTPENYRDFAKTMTDKFKIPPHYFPPLDTPEKITAHITKLQDMALSPKDRAALRTPKITNIPIGENIQPTAIYPGGEMTPVGPGGPRWSPQEGGKGEFGRLIEFHQQIRPDIEPTEESLKDLFDKFNRRGLNLNNDVNFQATKQASISLSQNIEFNTLDPSNPQDAAKREKMLIDETKRLKRGMTGQVGKTVTPPSYPATIQKADGVYTKTGQVDPATGKPIYKAPNGELVLPK